MTIQPSVLIWSVVCFCLLALVLDRLLFRPLLSVMDKRQEKIDAARAKKNAALQERQEQADRAEQEFRLAENRAVQAAADALEEAHRESERALAEKKAENIDRLNAEKAALEREKEALELSLAPEVEAWSLSAARRMLS